VKRIGPWIVTNMNDVQHISGLFASREQLLDTMTYEGVPVLRHLIRLCRPHEDNTDLIEAYRHALGGPPPVDLWQDSVALVRWYSRPRPRLRIE
jgi:hypothetical protein